MCGEERKRKFTIKIFHKLFFSLFPRCLLDLSMPFMEPNIVCTIVQYYRQIVNLIDRWWKCGRGQTDMYGLRMCFTDDWLRKKSLVQKGIYWKQRYFCKCICHKWYLLHHYKRLPDNIHGSASTLNFISFVAYQVWHILLKQNV